MSIYFENRCKYTIFMPNIQDVTTKKEKYEHKKSYSSVGTYYK